MHCFLSVIFLPRKAVIAPVNPAPAIETASHEKFFEMAYAARIKKRIDIIKVKMTVNFNPLRSILIFR